MWGRDPPLAAQVLGKVSDPLPEALPRPEKLEIQHGNLRMAGRMCSPEDLT